MVNLEMEEIVDLITIGSTAKLKINNFNIKLDGATDIDEWCAEIENFNKNLDKILPNENIANFICDKKTMNRLRKFKFSLNNSVDINKWCDEALSINKELLNIVYTMPHIEYVEIDEKTYKENFLDEESIYRVLDFKDHERSEITLLSIKANLEFIKKSNEIDDYVWVKETELKLFGSKKTANKFYHWADSEELLDYFNKLPGWLSEKGEVLLIRLGELGY